MKAVFEEALRMLEAGQPIALATVVHTRGSTPQGPGAKLLVRQDGSAVGTLGGGCVEGDIWFAARELLREGDGPVFRDYYLNEEIAARDGLVCGGSMYFFIEPVRNPEDLLSTVKEVVAAYRGGPPVALATVVNAGGGAKMGSRLLVRQDGTTVGTLGSSDLDQMAIEAGLELMPLGHNRHLMTASGDEVFIEGYTSPPTLVLMGGGHVNKAVAQIAQTIGFRVMVQDDRPEFASRERYPMAEQVAVAPYDRGLESFQISTNTAIVVATRGHRYDDLALEAAARSPARYVGLIGSKRKTILIFEQLLKRGVPLERIKEVHAPIGLDIGGRSPEEIAVSIVAELVQFWRGGTGRPMKLDEERIERLYQKVQRGGRQSASSQPASR
ncbi:MAG: XdhC family protein [Chloroflexi bacterium]|nr:XdhC family protein [Chloroflexota bacterium]